MSQVNIQNLLQMPAIEPTQVQRTPVEFREASFSGGGFTPGRMADLPAKSSEQYMYESLAQIATGTQQGLNIFADISQRIDRQRIDETETEWSRIDAQDIDPREKVNQFNQYVNQVSTPMSGELWKKKMANQMAKSWGQEAFEKFVQEQYTEQAQTWKDYDGKMGPVVTDRFLTEFEKNNPSLTGSNFVKSLRLQTTKQLEAIQDQLTSNALIANLAQGFTLDGSTMKALTEGTGNTEQLRSLHPNTFKFVELANSSVDMDEFSEHLAKEFYTPIAEQVEGFNPEVQLDIKLKLDQIFPNIVKNIWEQASIVRQAENQRAVQAQAITAQTSFSAAPNPQTLQNYGIQSRQVLQNQTELEQVTYLGNVINNIYQGLATSQYPGYGNFSSLPPNQQMQIVEKLFTEAIPLNELFSTTLKHEAFKHINTPDKLKQFLFDGFKTSQAGQAMQAGVIKSIDERATNILDLLSLDPSVSQETALGRYAEEVAQATGVTIKEAVALFFKTETQDGVEFTSFDTRTVAQKQKENPNLLEPFFKAGLTPSGLAELDKGLAAINAFFSKQKSSRSATDLFAERKFQTVDEAYKGLYFDTDRQRQGRLVLEQPGLLNEVSESKRQDLLFLAQAVQKADIFAQEEARNIIVENLVNSGEFSKEDKTLYYSSGPLSLADQGKQAELKQKVNEMGSVFFGVPVEKIQAFDATDPVNFDSFLRKTWVDERGSLTPEGRLNGLRAKLYSKELASDVGTPGRDAFMANLVDNLETISSSDAPIDNQNQGMVYSTLFMLQGLGFADSVAVTALGNQSKLDNALGTQFIRWLATNPIPDNLGKQDELTGRFVTALQVMSTAVAGGETAGEIIDPSTSQQIGVNSFVSKLIGLQLRWAYPGTLRENPVEFLDNATKVWGSALGLSAGTTNSTEILNNIYSFLSPFFSPGNNSSVSILPAPDYTGNLQVFSPGENTLKLWSAMAIDEKLLYYLNAAEKGAGIDVIRAALTIGVVANERLGRDDSPDYIADPINRAVAVDSLVRAGLDFNEIRGIRKDKPVLSYEIGERSFGFTGPGWSPLIARPDTVPGINIESEEDERADPSFVLSELTRQYLGTNTFPSWEELDEVLQASTDAEAANRFRNIFEMQFSTGTTTSLRPGIRSRLDPVGQIVVGMAALPATEDNVNYLVTAFTDGFRTSEDVDNLQQALQNPANSELGALELLEKTDPEIFNTVATKIKDLRIGYKNPTQPNTMPRISTNKDRSSAYIGIAATPDLDIPILPLPKQPFVNPDKTTNPNIHVGAKRLMDALLLLDRIQNPSDYISKIKPANRGTGLLVP